MLTQVEFYPTAICSQIQHTNQFIMLHIIIELQYNLTLNKYNIKNVRL